MAPATYSYEWTIPAQSAGSFWFTVRRLPKAFRRLSILPACTFEFHPAGLVAVNVNRTIDDAHRANACGSQHETHPAKFALAYALQVLSLNGCIRLPITYAGVGTVTRLTAFFDWHQVGSRS